MTIFQKRVKIGVYTVEKFLAKGGFGEVYRVTYNDKPYAMKVFNFATRGAKEDKKAEVDAYKIVSKFPTCITYITCMYASFDINYKGQSLGIIILEFMSGGDIGSYIGNKKFRQIGIPPVDLVILMREYLSGLAFIHSKNLAHRDIKPGNLMTNSDHTLFKIGDMGGGCGNHLKKCVVWGTLKWFSPEFARSFVNMGNACTQPINVKEAQKADIWALGLVFWEMAFGKNKSPINNKTVKQIASINNQIQIPKPNYQKNAAHIPSKVINNILYWMLQADPNNRESAEDLLKYLRDEIAGCKVDGKYVTRKEIISEGIKDTKLGKYLSDNGYTDMSSINSVCILLNNYLVYRKKEYDTAQAAVKTKSTSKHRAKPKIDSDNSMSCYINKGDIKIKELKSIAKILSANDELVKNKWWEEASKLKLCQYVWKHIFEAKKIRANYVASDIFRGIQMAVQDDMAAGIDPLANKQGKKAAKQTIMIQSILNIIKHATPDDIDIKALKAEKKNYNDALDKLRMPGKYLNPEDVKKDHFYRRLLSYLHTVLNELDKMQNNECINIMCELGIKSKKDYNKWMIANHPDKTGDDTIWKKYQSKASVCRDKKLFCP